MPTLKDLQCIRTGRTPPILSCVLLFLDNRILEEYFIQQSRLGHNVGSQQDRPSLGCFTERWWHLQTQSSCLLLLPVLFSQHIKGRNFLWKASLFLQTLLFDLPTALDAANPFWNRQQDGEIDEVDYRYQVSLQTPPWGLLMGANDPIPEECEHQGGKSS